MSADVLKLGIDLFFIIISVQSYAQREFLHKDGDTTYTMKRYVFVLLNKGDVQITDSLQSAKIQAGHMEHIGKMAKTGKLVSAGPFEKSAEHRGLLLFDLDTVEEAIKLASDDPAVLAGRLKIEAFYWWAAKGTVLK